MPPAAVNPKQKATQTPGPRSTFRGNSRGSGSGMSSHMSRLDTSTSPTSADQLNGLLGTASPPPPNSASSATQASQQERPSESRHSSYGPLSIASYFLDPNTPPNDTEIGSPRRFTNSERSSPDFAQSPEDMLTLSEVQLVVQRPMKRFCLGLDVGTAFTNVSYAVGDSSGNWSVHKQIAHWPGDTTAGGFTTQVPTAIWYPPTPMDRQRHSKIRGALWSKMIVGSNLLGGNSTAWDNSMSTRVLYGYEAVRQKLRENTESDLLRLVDRPKILLMESPHTAEAAQQIWPAVRYLVKSGHIRKFSKSKNPTIEDTRDIITDYLVQIFGRIKQMLASSEGYDESCAVDVCLSVPVGTFPIASRKVLQMSVEDAMYVSNFTTSTTDSIGKLTFVFEPEAAVIGAVSTRNTLVVGESVAVVDVGAGTGDVGIYTVGSTQPLTLRQSLGDPVGDICGSSFLNDRFATQVRSRVASLDIEAELLENRIRKVTAQFEIDKKLINIYESPVEDIEWEGVRADAEKGFRNNYIRFTRDDYWEIFHPILVRIERLVSDLLKSAATQEHNVEKVFLVGGFGDSPSLQAHLERVLPKIFQELGKEQNSHFQLITHPDHRGVNAVADGAVLKALNPGVGPPRVSCARYGIKRREYYEPEADGHGGYKPYIDFRTRAKMIDVIAYHMMRNTVAPSTGVLNQHGKLRCIHDFHCDSKELLAREIIYMNYTTEDCYSGYPLEASFNKSAFEIGEVITDFSWLLRPEHATELESLKVVPKREGKRGAKSEPYWQVEYDLVCTIKQMKLVYQSVYPPITDGEVGGEDKTRFRSTSQINIACSFEPGTQ